MVGTELDWCPVHSCWTDVTDRGSDWNGLICESIPLCLMTWCLTWLELELTSPSRDDSTGPWLRKGFAAFDRDGRAFGALDSDCLLVGPGLDWCLALSCWAGIIDRWSDWNGLIFPGWHIPDIPFEGCKVAVGRHDDGWNGRESGEMVKLVWSLAIIWWRSFVGNWIIIRMEYI